jgi:hypothetical protein
MSETQICEEVECVDENGMVWIRYVGQVGPMANTVKGLLYIGDCVLVDPSEVEFVMSSGDWQLLKRGRCKAKAEISGERCIQECAKGMDICAWHIDIERLKQGE